MTDLDYIPVGNNDLRAADDTLSGYVSLHLYDADDYDKFIIWEDDVVALRNYLNQMITKHNLPE